MGKIQGKKYYNEKDNVIHSISPLQSPLLLTILPTEKSIIYKYLNNITTKVRNENGKI